MRDKHPHAFSVSALFKVKRETTSPAVHVGCFSKVAGTCAETNRSASLCLIKTRFIIIFFQFLDTHSTEKFTVK